MATLNTSIRMDTELKKQAINGTKEFSVKLLTNEKCYDTIN